MDEGVGEQSQMHRLRVVEGGVEGGAARGLLHEHTQPAARTQEQLEQSRGGRVKHGPVEQRPSKRAGTSRAPKGKAKYKVAPSPEEILNVNHEVDAAREAFVRHPSPPRHRPAAASA